VFQVFHNIYELCLILEADIQTVLYKESTKHFTETNDAKHLHVHVDL